MKTGARQVADCDVHPYVEARRLGEADLLARVDAPVPDEEERRPRGERRVDADFLRQELDAHDRGRDRRVRGAGDDADEAEGREEPRREVQEPREGRAARGSEEEERA